MKPPEEIKNLLKQSAVFVSSEKNDKILNAAVTVYEKTQKGKSDRSKLNIWRIIMKSKMTKFATAGIIFAIIIGFSMLKGTPVWAIEQTIQALKNIQTVTITGTTVYYDSNNAPEYKPFKCWIKLGDENGNLLMRVESPREIVVVQGDKVYFRRPGSNIVKIIYAICNSCMLCVDVYRCTTKYAWRHEL